MEQLLKRLSAARGVSGSEAGVAAVVKTEMEAICDEVYIDNLGSVIGKKAADCPHPTRVLLEAHMDEVGLMVKEITQDGFLLFAPIGGLDPKVLPGAEVVVHGKEDLYGVIGAKPPHLLSGKREVLSMDDMAIDAGFSSREEAKKHLRIGSTATFRTDVTPLLGGRIAGRCLDDRAGLMLILEAAKRIQNSNVELYLSASVQEEVGLRGAGVAAKRIAPHLAIAVDVTHGDSPDADKKTFPLGKGPAILVGPNAHPAMTQKMIEIAKKQGISYQLEVDGSGDSGTDAAIMQVMGAGIPTMLLSIPLRYMHTHHEVMDLSDAEAGVRLLTEFVNEI